MNAMPSQPHSLDEIPCILIVEDEFITRIAICEEFRESGFTVIEACNGDEAADILRSGARIDLMLSDVRMPGKMDGLALLEYALDLLPTLPVIITSGHLLPTEALSKGAAQFLGKPYSTDDAIKLVKLELAKSQ